MTREQDWIEWAGGWCPVAAEADTEVRLRDGSTQTRAAGTYRWWSFNDDRDIIAYRLVEPAEHDPVAAPVPAVDAWTYLAGKIACGLLSSGVDNGFVHYNDVPKSAAAMADALMSERAKRGIV